MTAVLEYFYHEFNSMPNYALKLHQNSLPHHYSQNYWGIIPTCIGHRDQLDLMYTEYFYHDFNSMPNYALKLHQNSLPHHYPQNYWGIIPTCIGHRDQLDLMYSFMQ